MISEVMKLVTDNKIQPKKSLPEDKKDVKHKDYGKVPDYIKKYEIEREQQKRKN